MVPGEIKRVRLINAGGQDALYIGLNTEAARVCTMSLLALDGVYLSAARQESALFVPSGGRADIAVRCNRSGRFSLATVYDQGPWFKVYCNRTDVLCISFAAREYLLYTNQTFSAMSLTCIMDLFL